MRLYSLAYGSICYGVIAHYTPNEEVYIVFMNTVSVTSTDCPEALLFS